MHPGQGGGEAEQQAACHGIGDRCIDCACCATALGPVRLFILNSSRAVVLQRLVSLPSKRRLLRQRLRGRRHQPRYRRRQVVASLLGAVISFAALGAGGLIVAPFGATAMLLFGNPGSPLAQPRNVVAGSCMAALISVVCVQLLGQAPWVMGLAVGATIALGQLLRCLHPPAGVLAVLGVLQGASWRYLLVPVLPGAVLLVLLAAAYHRLSGLGHRYPVHWL